MPERMKPYTLSLCLLAAVLYLGVQALTGERGLLGATERDALLEQRASQLHDLAEQRRDLEVRVRYLRSESLSRDLLEERARAVLGFTDPRDYVIRVAAPAPAAAAPARS